jgi:5-methylthioribose kinase
MSQYDLSTENILAYLSDYDIVNPYMSVDIQRLGGGVSNKVLQIRTDDDCFVVKQPLPNLAVEDDWPADRERAHNEASAARVFGDII